MISEISEIEINELKKIYKAKELVWIADPELEVLEEEESYYIIDRFYRIKILIKDRFFKNIRKGMVGNDNAEDFVGREIDRSEFELMGRYFKQPEDMENDVVQFLTKHKKYFSGLEIYDKFVIVDYLDVRLKREGWVNLDENILKRYPGKLFDFLDRYHKEVGEEKGEIKLYITYTSDLLFNKITKQFAIVDLSGFGPGTSRYPYLICADNGLENSIYYNLLPGAKYPFKVKNVFNWKMRFQNSKEQNEKHFSG